MRYVVFGGSGFVGRYTIAALQRAMAQNRIKCGEILCVDIADFVPLKDEKCGENLGNFVNFSQNLGENLEQSVNLNENSQENSHSAQNTHPQTPSAREGAFESTQNSQNSAPNHAQNSQISVKFVRCDISKDFDFAFEKDDIVVHLAARAYAPKPPLKPFGTHRLKEYFASVNVAGTRRIVAQMLAHGCSRLVYFSTDMVYGKPEFLPVSTAHPRRPFGYYGLSKRESEDFIIATRERERVEGVHFPSANDTWSWAVWDFAQTFRANGA